MSPAFPRISAHITFSLLFISCSPPEQIEATPTPAPCADSVSDGMIHVPSECPSLTDAVSRADESETELTITLDPGVYQVDTLSVGNGTAPITLTGASSSEMPVIQCRGTFRAEITYTISV